MVFNKRDLAKAFSPSKVKRLTKRRLSGNGPKPSTSGSTASSVQAQPASQTSIKVIVRVRPENEREQQGNCRTIVKIVDDKMLIFDPKEEESAFFYQGVAQKGRDLLKKQNKELQFIFDKIFGTSASNNDVFEGSTKDLIASLLDGYNCSVFAYGATGAGKTHTMLGSCDDPGITYRTVAELFSQIECLSEHREFNLGVTYLEIYNENVQDLLHKSGPLHLRDDGRCGVIVAGLKIIPIQNAQELLTLLAKGNKNRTQHPTDANEESSRSHAVFQVYVNITNKLDGQVRHVKLSMIDLAGSERASATGCKGMRFKEGANINKSLLALGNCINNLADGAKHITYRDSKLTRLLKDSLGGNCQTVMIANVAPSSLSYEDTYNTLRYANRAKKIKTHVKKNIVSCEMHVTTYIKMVEEQKKEIEYLKQKLSAFENGSAVVPSEPKDVEERNEECSSTIREMFRLLDKKKSLNEKVLALESADKILCCRIRNKKAADERLHTLTATVDALNPEEQNASGKSRIQRSLHYFERQRDSLRVQMEAAWEELCSVETEIQRINDEIRSKGLEKSKEQISLRVSQIEKSRMRQQYEHARKICNLLHCELESTTTLNKMLGTTLQSYYNLMRGYGTMTDKMKEEFKQLIKLLEGVRNIKWSDMETVDREEHFYGLTCLSVAQLNDPLNAQIPLYVQSPTKTEDADADVDATGAKDILNATFDAPCPKTDDTADVHNATITLQEKPWIKEESTETSIALACIPDKGRKRVLADKNQVNPRTPTKVAKKISPKQKSATHGINTTGKENKHVQKPLVVMNAKTTAILNKMKADKLKTMQSLTKGSFDSDTADGSLKAVREKERRGLMTAHPYQKPSGKQKSTPALPSSRVPW